MIKSLKVHSKAAFLVRPYDLFELFFSCAYCFPTSWLPDSHISCFSLTPAAMKYGHFHYGYLEYFGGTQEKYDPQLRNTDLEIE